MDNKKATPSALRAGIRWIIQITVFILILAAILFLSAGRLDWPMARVYLGVFTACLLFNGVYLARRNPALLKERSEFRPRQDVEKWDIVVSTLVRIFVLAALVVCGLDQRFGWTGAMPLAVQLLALSLGFLGFALIMWALASNPFAAVYARIQAERGHAVAMTGPYRFVRHPFYTGVLMYVLTLPATLGSLWALILGAMVVILFIVKTTLEGRKLQVELDGYQEFARRVRYRLLPGVW
jgi:protein-S-isoprenylcysteine O-methyltransferase Ste14